LALRTYTVNLKFRTAVSAPLIALESDIRSAIAHSPNNLDILAASITRDDGHVTNLLTSDPSPVPHDGPLPADPAHTAVSALPSGNEF
jgi:hypothetical protein